MYDLRQFEQDRLVLELLRLRTECWIRMPCGGWYAVARSGIALAPVATMLGGF